MLRDGLASAGTVEREDAGVQKTECVSVWVGEVLLE